MAQFSPDMKQERHWFHNPWLLVLAIVFVLLGGAFVGLTIHSAQNVLKNEGTKFTLNPQTTAQTAPGTNTQLVGENDPSLGPNDAPVVIVEFGDYQCPYCQEAFSTVRQLMNKYEGQIHFVFRDYPVTEAHPLAFFAAQAGQCAWEQGANQYWALHDRMFIEQSEMTEEKIIAWAKQSGVNASEFTACMTSGRYDEEITDDFSDGLALGVRGTPTFFINGRKVEGALPIATFEQLLNGLVVR